MYAGTHLIGHQRAVDLKYLFQTLDHNADGYLSVKDIEKYLYQSQIIPAIAHK